MGSPGSRRVARIATAFALVVLLVPFVAEMLPRSLRDEVAVTSTPVPENLPQPGTLPLAAGQQACLDDVVVDPTAERARIALSESAAWPSPPLEVEIAGPGYRVLERVQQREQGNRRFELALDPPRRAIRTSFCVRNVGDVATMLAATADPRALEHSGRALVDGVTQPTAFVLTFVRAQPSSPLDRLPESIRRAAMFSAVGPWVYWLLLPLLFLGVPALVFGALYRAMRSDYDAGGAAASGGKAARVEATEPD